MVGGDSRGDGGQETDSELPQEQPATAKTSSNDATSGQVELPRQSALYFAHHSDRYTRQGLINTYEQLTGAKLVVAIDVLSNDFVQNLEEHLLDMPEPSEIHLMLRSPGGDGEQAVRAVRHLQSRSTKLVVVVPDIAKSAATLVALGADEVHLGPTSDLGPVDPQMLVGKEWTSAKSLLDAVNHAQDVVSANKAATPLWASLLADVSALTYQNAQMELKRTTSMVEQVLSYRTSPPDDIQDQVDKLVEELQTKTSSHGTSIGAPELRDMGVTVVELDAVSDLWKCVFRLWTLYWVQVGGPIYESRFGSYRPEGPQPA